MTSKKEDASQELTDAEINGLFNRFSFPMVRPCITSPQKHSAVGIAKILWLRLVTGTDTDENIYNDLRGVFGDNHDSNVAIGSMYFFKMKTGLTEAEIHKLRDHYSSDKNFNRLQVWEPPDPSDLRKG